MNVDKIAKLENVLALDGTKTISNYTLQRLTAPGDNYGSLMLSVDIDLKTSDGSETIKAVAKLVPPNEFIQMVFNTQLTFRNEIAFYKHIIPTLQAFQREQGMGEVLDLAPRYYGSRLNIDDNDNAKVDSDAILLLENLKAANYVNLDRIEGFDLQAAKLIIRDLAQLHAAALGLKLTKPSIFETKVKKYLAPLQPPPHDAGFEVVKKNIRQILEGLDGCQPWIEKAMSKISELPVFESREPFATLIHCDCWVNNTMVRMEGSNPVKSKLVDFQICDYGSPAKDLLFFIYTSIKNDVIEKNYERLVSYYHEIFTEVLQDLKCDIKKFSFEAFLEEMDYEAMHSQFPHIVMMLFPIFKQKGEVAELSEFTPSTFAETTKNTTVEHNRKLAFVVQQFGQRGWL